MHVRLATAHDGPSILAIHNHYVAHSTVIFDMVPRTAIEQDQWMADHSGAYPAVVAEDEGVVIGFGAIGSYRPRPAYAMTVEDSVYVAEGAQGRGAGTALLTELVDLAASFGYHSMIARIAGGNEASVALHARCGFATIGVEREVWRKFNTWLDVVAMQRIL